MGYRKAAMMRRTQYVGGHYRRGKNGGRHWVRGHVRNEGLDFERCPWPPIKWGLVWAIFFAPLTCGLSGVAWLICRHVRKQRSQ